MRAVNRTAHVTIARRGAVVLGAWLALAIFLPVAPSSAFDGRLVYREDHQEGSASSSDYSYMIRRREGTATQLIPLGAHLNLEADYRAWLENSESAVNAQRSELSTESQRGGLSMQFNSSPFRLSLSGLANRRDVVLGNAPEQRNDRLHYGAWMNLRLGSSFKLRANWYETESWRYTNRIEESRAGEMTASLNAETRIPRFGQLKYKYSRIEHETVIRNALDINTTHGLYYSGNRTFHQSRGAVSLQTRSQYFTQRSIFRSPEERAVLLLPFTAAYVVDASPEIQDPLEDPLITVAALADGDRGTGTVIDIGDEAPVGWQYGGDYRNIVYDFGENVAIGRALLYVDRIVTLPDFMQWEAYTSNDPSGQIWQKVPAGSLRIEYQDWSTGLQGWDIRLDDPVAARFFKLVNIKIGPLIPELRVTEMEVYAPAADQQAQPALERDTWSNRLSGDLAYKLSDATRIQYNTTLRRRNFQDDAETLTENSHGLSLQWLPGDWSIVGRLEIHRVGRGEFLSSNVFSRSVGLQRGIGKTFGLMANWYQVDDDSDGVDKLTNTMTLGADWRPASGLHMSQKISYARLSDYAFDLSSNAFSVYTLLNTKPTTWLSMNLRRQDRWVEQVAGAGFTQFNDTNFELTWMPLDKISYRGHVRLQERADQDWFFSHSLTWALIRSKKFTLRLNGSQFKDTRAELRQSGAGATITWRPHGALRLEGGADFTQYTRGDSANSPLNSYFKGSFLF